MFDPMADLADNSAMSEDPLGGSFGTAPSAPQHGGGHHGGSSRRQGGGQGGGAYADEIHSITIRARQRTFYLDLKESGNGRFFKLSEKSRGGRKTTIMFDAEDLPELIKAFQEMQTKL